MLLALAVTLASSGFVGPHGRVCLPTASRHAPALLGEREQVATDIDVSPAATDIQEQMSEFELYQSRVGKGLNADKQNPDGSIPLDVKFDIRWFLFLSLFAAGEDSILEVTAPLREMSVGGVQPFDAVISVLAGPVVRSADASATGGLHDVPTGGAAILALYFLHWKGWLADGTRAMGNASRKLKQQLEGLRSEHPLQHPLLAELDELE